MDAFLDMHTLFARNAHISYSAWMFIFFFLLLSSFVSAQELTRSGFFTNATLLYWQAEEAGLGYAIETSSSKIKVPQFDWDFGFKVGIGYRIPHDSWDLSLQATSFQTHTDCDHHGNFLPSWQVPGPTHAFAEDVKMHWRLHMGLLDLNLQKELLISERLILTPQIGIRAGMIRQKFNLEYRGGTFSSKGDLLRMKNKYWGFGPRIGAGSEWEMARGFSLFAEGAFSLLYGEFYLHQDEYEQGSKEEILGVHNIFHNPAPILDASAGLRWQYYFSSALKRLRFDLKWDQLLLFSQNQLMRFTDENEPGLFVSNQGDLGISGIEFNIQFDF
ncbi:MAG: hypothetical protein HYX67_08205 [Candidatus Melainabacteria bacterium]|nr:hypothetical protein [Candidatus Melainabacteria bacterium]